MKAESSESRVILTPDAIDILRRACKNAKSQAAVLQNPRAFLARHGIEIRDDIELRIYKRKKDIGGRVGEPALAEQLLGKSLEKYSEALKVSSALDTWWRGTHDGCPFPTVPYKTQKKVTVCDLWGVFAGPREWVQDVPGTPYGHWEYPQAQTVCLHEHEEIVEVIECLPRFAVPPP